MWPKSTRQTNVTTDSYLVSQVQTVAVSGIVRDRNTREVLSGVAVALTREDDRESLGSDTTGEDGSYSIQAPSRTALHLAFSLSGYDSKEFGYVYAPDYLEIALEPETPPAVRDVQTRPGLDNVLVTWQVGTDPDIVGYNVYRGGQPLNDLPVGVPQYVDFEFFAKAGQAYTITAVDENGNESEPSEEVEGEAGAIAVWLTHSVLEPDAETRTWVRVPVNIQNAYGTEPAGGDISMSYSNGPVRCGLCRANPHVRTLRVASQRGWNHGRVSTGAGEHPDLRSHRTARGHGRAREAGRSLPPPRRRCGERFLRQPASERGSSSTTPWHSQSQSTTRLLKSEFCVEEACILGDVNADGFVDNEDIAEAQRIAVQMVPMDPPDPDPAACMWRATDLNGDEEIDSADCILIQRLIAGLPLGLDSEESKILLRTALKDGATRVLTVGTETAVAGGDPVTVSVSIDDASLGGGIRLRRCPTPPTNTS